MNSELTDLLVAGMRKPSAPELALVNAVYRHLLRGRPAPVAEVAAAAGWDLREAKRRLDTWPAVFRDERGDVIGFWGVSSQEMPIRVRTTAGEASFWCALDPLFILPLLGREGEVQATCPVSGAPVTVRVSPDGAHPVEPGAPAVSLMAVDGELGDDVQDRFCHYVRFFRDVQAAAAWTADHEGTSVATLEEAGRLGREIARAIRGGAGGSLSQAKDE